MAIDQQRHRMIRHAVLRDPERAIDASIVLWRGLAGELAAIVGERGFESLYARCLHQVSARYPWLGSQVSGPREAIFADLLQRLREQGMPEAGAAIVALLTIFIDTLILLIGELVTTSILRAAWGDDAVNYAGTEPEQ